MSQIWDDLSPDRPERPGTAWFARIASVPDDMGDEVMVTIPSFDTMLQFGPCRWQSRDSTSKPQLQDPCLVVRDDRDDYWVIAWWPKEFDSA